MEQLPVNPVPVFNCQVHVGREGDNVVARVANLDGLAVTSDNERSALQQIVTQFKRRMAEYHESGETIPWIDPPHPAKDSEVTRLIPVHL